MTNLLHASLATVLILLASCASQRDAAGPKRARVPEDYQARSLAELSALDAGETSLGNKEETMRVDGDVRPTSAVATCDGVTRPIPSIKAEVLRQWARLYAGSMEHYTVPYATEMRFTDDGREHWVAVRTSDLPALQSECAASRAIELRVIRLGAAIVDDRWEPLLLLESTAVVR